MNTPDEHNLIYAIMLALQTEHGDPHLIERVVAESIIDAATHGYFGDRMVGMGARDVRVFCLKRYGYINLELVIPTLSTNLILVKCEPHPEHDSFDSFSGEHFRQYIRTYWDVSLSFGAEARLTSAYYHGSTIQPIYAVRCKCGKELPSWTRQCIDCAALEGFKRDMDARVRAGFDTFLRIVLTCGVILWESLDDSTKRFALLDSRPSKTCPPDVFEPTELEL